MKRMNLPRDLASFSSFEAYSDRTLLQTPGDFIRYMLADSSLSARSELSSKTGIDLCTLENIFSGALPLLSEHAEPFANLLGCPPDTLLDIEREFTRFATGPNSGTDSDDMSLFDDAALDRFLGERIITELMIRRRVAALALDIRNTFEENFFLVPIMNGACLFAADLLRYLFKLRINPPIEFIRLERSEPEDGSPRAIEEHFSLEARRQLERHEPYEANFLFLDDICDNGLTLGAAMQLAEYFSPNSVKSCVLLNKTSGRVKDFQEFRPDLVGFEVGSGWVFGYGMDFGRGRFRGAPSIRQLASEQERS